MNVLIAKRFRANNVIDFYFFFFFFVLTTDTLVKIKEEGHVFKEDSV